MLCDETTKKSIRLVLSLRCSFLKKSADWWRRFLQRLEDAIVRKIFNVTAVCIEEMMCKRRFLWRLKCLTAKLWEVLVHPKQNENLIVYIMLFWFSIGFYHRYYIQQPFSNEKKMIHQFYVYDMCYETYMKVLYRTRERASKLKPQEQFENPNTLSAPSSPVMYFTFSSNLLLWSTLNRTVHAEPPV